ncbi:relaxase/mobilization nuclease domain-containing protein (plasmid) [Roseomonas sp. CCTCC AB2023176]|uniref:relaxase/mobilization nuclease domain-containing protein n=1 Tax=Roseomonas sp. CCTCC AB2023176 TaxID=3342640 RepID=UPI0035DB5D17
MADGVEDAWRLPGEVRGGDVRLGGAASPLSAEGKARLRRIVTRAPEAMVKVTGRARGGAAALRAHLDYITRGGRLALETGDGARITNRAGLRALEEDWVLANAAGARGPAVPHASQSVALALSMPAGTPADRVEDAARAWARETFGGTHDWAMARHDDRGHPHVHVTVRAVGRDGLRLAPGPADLRAWRERFARELRARGIEAEATPRQVRGVTRKRRGATVERIVERGGVPRPADRR